MTKPWTVNLMALMREFFLSFRLPCERVLGWAKSVRERESEIVISERDRKYVRQVPLSFEMPVGCLGAPAPPSPASREAPASLAEKMELMQQTLLIQIFRMETSTSLSCSTCSSFSRTCCQVDSGWQVTRRCCCWELAFTILPEENDVGRNSSRIF